MRSSDKFVNIQPNAKIGTRATRVTLGSRSPTSKLIIGFYLFSHLPLIGGCTLAGKAASMKLEVPGSSGAGLQVLVIAAVPAINHLNHALICSSCQSSCFFIAMGEFVNIHIVGTCSCIRHTVPASRHNLFCFALPNVANSLHLRFGQFSLPQ